MKFFRSVLAAVLLFVGGTAFAQNSFSVEAPNVVGQNETFKIVFVADGEVSEFTRPTFTGLDVLAGPTQSMMQSYQSINGKSTSSIQLTYTYVLRPTAAGVAKVSSAAAVIKGKEYRTRELSIEVVPGQAANSGTQRQQGVDTGNEHPKEQLRSTGEVSSDDVFLRLNFSKTNVVEGEPITATLKLYTRVPIAGFEDIKFPVFNGFWSQEIENVQNVNFVRENVGGEIYNSAVLQKYILLPQQTGNLSITPSEMICQVQMRVTGNRPRSIFDDFFDSGYQIVKKRVNSGKASIKVAPLPAGAPADFGGGVGDFSLDVALSRDSVKAHEAGSVVITVKGAGNLNLIEAPKIDLPADFELYDVKTDNKFNYGVNGIQGSKRFEFPFIPRSEGRFTVPPVKYSYYDVKARKYVTLQSDTLLIKVAKGESGSATPALVPGISKQAVANLGEDVRYILTGPAGLRQKGHLFVGSLWFFLIIALVIAVYVLLYYLLDKHVKLAGDVVRTRNRKANKVARRRLRQAYTYMSGNLRAAFYEELHKALLGYISDKLSIQFADMQRDTIKETMEEKGVSQQNITDFLALLDECEMARYSQETAEGGMEQQYKKAISVISNLEDKL